MLLAMCGCNAIAGIDELRPNEAASTSMASTSGATGGGGTGGARQASSSHGVGGAGGAPTGCTAQYGDAPAFMLCLETNFSCMFYAEVQPESCSSLCANHGGECMQVFNNANDIPTCTLSAPQSCTDTTLKDAICSCSDGCGQGPPCPPGQVCTGGMCN